MNKEMKEHVISVGIYKADQWETLKALSADTQDMENTFEEWLEYATQKIKELETQGIHIRKITVDVFELQQWCKKKNLPINGESRAQYIANLSRGTGD